MVVQNSIPANAPRHLRQLSLAIIVVVVIMLFASGAATWMLSLRYDKPTASNVITVEEATRLLVASGAKIRVEARSRALLPKPILDSLPDSIGDAARRLECVHRVVFDDGTKFTAEAATLMNCFPDLSLEATGAGFDDTSLACLEHVKPLKAIYLVDTAVTDAEIARFRNAHPDIRVSLRTAASLSEPIASDCSAAAEYSSSADSSEN